MSGLLHPIVRRLRILFTWLAFFSIFFHSLGGVFFVTVARADETVGELPAVVEETAPSDPEPVAGEESVPEVSLPKPVAVDPEPVVVDVPVEVDPEPVAVEMPVGEPQVEPTVAAVVTEISPTPEEVVVPETVAANTLTEPVEVDPEPEALPDFDLEEAVEAEESARRVYSVGTDKADYAPWETALITGTGYDPNQALEIRVTWPDGLVRNSAGELDQVDSVTADGEGNLSFLYDLRGEGQDGEYLLEVLSGGVVLVTGSFTDSAVQKYTICHIAGQEGSDHAITLELPYASVYGPGGHFNEGGSPQAGHEQDYFGVCVAVCGNGIVEDDSEQCDDGNTNDGDGCSANCTIEESRPTPTPTGYPIPTPVPEVCPNDFIAIDPIDQVDLGDASSETAHLATGWGADPGGGNYGGRDLGGNFALVVDPTECDAEGRRAAVTFTVPAGQYANQIQVRHLDGLSNYDSFSLYINDALYAHYTDIQDSAEIWDTSSWPLPNLTGTVKVELELTDEIWNKCTTWGQLAINWIEIAGYECPGANCDNEALEPVTTETACDEPGYWSEPSAVINIGDPASEAGYNLVDWGPIEPASSGGNWGGACEDSNCRVVWAPDEADGHNNREATFDLDLGSYPNKELHLQALNGISKLDSFEVYIGGNLVYRWLDDPNTLHPETWTTHVVDASGYTGVQTIKLVAIDCEWPSFVDYGQVAFTWVELWGYDCYECGNETVEPENGEECDSQPGCDPETCQWELGQVTVCKYDDLDGDGELDEGEPGLGGVTMTLEKKLVDDNFRAISQESVGFIEPSSWQLVGQADTGEDGCVTFTDLVLGDYRVSEDLADLPGYTPTSDETVYFPLFVRGQAETVNFLNHLAPISLSLDKDNSVSGDEVTYTVKVKNTAETTAYDVWVKDSLPYGFDYVAGSTTGASEPTINGQLLTWSLGDLAPDEEVELAYRVIIGDLADGVYPNIAVAWGSNRPDGLGGEMVTYSNFDYSGIRISSGVSTTTVIPGQVLGASTSVPGAVLGAATGSPTGWVALAVISIISGLIFRLLGVREDWHLARIKKAKKILPFLSILVGLVFTGQVLAVESLYVRTAELPEYTPGDNFKLYYNALEVADRPVEVTCWVRKDEGFDWRIFGGTQTDPSGYCEVFGHDLDGDGKYFFYAVAKSSEGSSQSNETTTIVDRSAPGTPEDYGKSRQSNSIYKIEWQSPDNDDFAFVRIFAAKERNFTADDSTKVTDVGSAPDVEMSHLVTGLEPDIEYYFALQAFDKAGNASGLAGDGPGVTYVETMSDGTLAGDSPTYLGSSQNGTSPVGQILGDGTEEGLTDGGSEDEASFDIGLNGDEETKSRYWIWYLVGGGVLLLIGRLFFKEDKK